MDFEPENARIAISMARDVRRPAVLEPRKAEKT
jgi:hypothetical protein